MKKHPVNLNYESENPGNPHMTLRLPIELGLPLMAEAKKKKCTIQNLILSIVADHFSVEVAAPARGRPKKAVE